MVDQRASNGKALLLVKDTGLQGNTLKKISQTLQTNKNTLMISDITVLDYISAIVPSGVSLVLLHLFGL